jgi:hypothetical protein
MRARRIFILLPLPATNSQQTRLHRLGRIAARVGTDGQQGQDEGLGEHGG